MAADVAAGRFRPASSTSARVAQAAAGLTVAMFGVCGVLLLLTRDYQRAAYGAGGTVAALVCLAVGFVVARRQPASPIRWLLLGWSLLTPVVGVALLRAAGGRLPGPGAAGQPGPAVVFTGRGGGLDPGGGGVVPPAAPPGAAGGGPAVQPGPLQRRPDRHRIRGAAAGRRGPGRHPRRARERGARGAGAGPPVGLGSRSRPLSSQQTNVRRRSFAPAQRHPGQP